MNAKNKGAGRCSGISVAQCHVLLAIGESQPATTGDLSAELGLDKSTLSRTVDGLFVLGFVRRKTDGIDRRITRLSLTQKGEEACSEINRDNDTFFASVFEYIPAARRKTILSGFQLFVESMAKELNRVSHQ